MSRLEEADKILHVQLYYRNNESAAEALRKLGTLKSIKNRKELQHPLTVTNLIQKFDSWKQSLTYSMEGKVTTFRARNL